MDGAMKIDLGCGRTKLPGFIGLDRFALPGVDVIADLDARLPFASDCADLVYSSHAFEHVRELAQLVRELYRICKHLAQICIVTPYHTQGLNAANPYHLHPFNEHTPRFWTSCPVSPIDRADYDHPHAPMWGLLESDNRRADLDIRCVKMEFFYFREYRRLPPELQRWYRKHEQDVCDQVVYHLLVVKQPMSDEEFLHMAQTLEPFESPYVALRRLQERYEELEAVKCEAVTYSQKLESDYREALRYKDTIEADFREAVEYKDQLVVELQALRGYKDKLESDFQEVTRYKDKLEADFQEVRRYKDNLEADFQGVSRYKDKLEADLQEVCRYKDSLEADFHDVRRSKDRLESDFQFLVAQKNELEASYVQTRQDYDSLQRDATAARAEIAQLQQHYTRLASDQHTLQETLHRCEAVMREQQQFITTVAQSRGWHVLQVIRRLRLGLESLCFWRGHPVGWREDCR